MLQPGLLWSSHSLAIAPKVASAFTTWLAFAILFAVDGLSPLLTCCLASNAFVRAICRLILGYVPRPVDISLPDSRYRNTHVLLPSGRMRKRSPAPSLK